MSHLVAKQGPSAPSFLKQRMNILLDMDGVITNWMADALRVHNRENYVPKNFNFYAEWGMSADQFWEPIHDEGEQFWVDLDPYRNMLAVVELCQRFDPRFRICSTPSSMIESRTGKMKWLEKHLSFPQERVILTHNKYRYATSNTFLIDDSTANLTAFCNAGGIGVPYPQPWNAHGGMSIDHKTSIVKYILTQGAINGC